MAGEDTDFSAIGSDAPSSIVPTDLARKEDSAFALERAKEDHDHDRRLREQELGVIGRFFGNRDNAITYLVGLLVIISCAVIALIALLGVKGADPANEFFKAIGFAGMGFLTGKSFEAKKD